MPKVSSAIVEAGIRPLDKNGFVPLYYQIQQVLMQKIHDGELREGDTLASEKELSRQYRVSRMTARQALQALKAQGYALSERGRGTFVARPKVEKNIMHLRGFTEEMRERGMHPSSILLEQAVVAPDAELLQRLKLAEGDKVLRLRRIRLADGVPMALEESQVSLSRFPQIDRIDFSKHSLYQALRERYGVSVGYADELIEALPATRDEAERLKIPRKASSS